MDFTQPVENTLLRRQGEKADNMLAVLPKVVWTSWKLWTESGALFVFFHEGTGEGKDSSGDGQRQRDLSRGWAGAQARAVNMGEGVGWPACFAYKMSGAKPEAKLQLKNSSQLCTLVIQLPDKLTGLGRQSSGKLRPRPEPSSDGSQVLMEAGFGPHVLLFH